FEQCGNQTATVIALGCLKEYQFNNAVSLAAIKDVGGLETLVNLLQTENHKCIVGSLGVLGEVCHSREMQKQLTDMGAVQQLVELLSGPHPLLQSLSAEVLFNLAKIRKARFIVRKSGGIPILVDLLDVKRSLLTTPKNTMDTADLQTLDVLIGSVKALWSLSQCKKNKEEMRKAGCVKLLACLLRSVHQQLVVYTMGIVQQCASEKSYRMDIQSEGMLSEMVRFLSSENAQLKKHSASALFKCAEEAKTGQLVREHGGLDPLVSIMRGCSQDGDPELLAAATGAVWKCSFLPDNIRRLEQLNTVQLLVQLLNDNHEEVLTNVAGALGECAKLEHNREEIVRCGGIERLVHLLTYDNPQLLENVTKVLGECANNAESMAKIAQLDGVRFIWSLLKNKSNSVQSTAASALVPCIKNYKGSAEMVRSLVGGLELLVSLLKSEDKDVVRNVCLAISHIAADRDNLAVITDHGVIPLLCNLVDTEEDGLRESVSLAMGSCCMWGDNCLELGKLGAVPPLVSYMASSDPRVHRSTALALYNLSSHPFNCITLHRSGVVPYLLVTIASSDESVQQASAGCLSNIRRLALIADSLR
ncbi:hypothetical protein AAG570_012918, partial [Ranatra chinensis]